MVYCKNCGRYTNEAVPVTRMVTEPVCMTCYSEMGKDETSDVQVLHVDPEKEKLVINFECLLKPDVMNSIQKHILKQYEQGVVVLPRFCKVVVVPKEAEVEM